MLVAKFNEIVANFPNKCAIFTGNDQITYKKLHLSAQLTAQQINTLYNEINKTENIPYQKQTIALLFEHGIDMITSVLASLIAEKIYVPFDPSYPQKRLVHMLQDSGATLLVTNSENLKFARSLANDCSHDVEILSVSVPPAALRGRLCGEHQGEAPPGPPVALRAGGGDTDEGIGNEGISQFMGTEENDRIAYLLYTSGSTGKPKGVVQTEKNILHYINCYTNTLSITENDRLTLFSAFSHDASIMDIYTALLNGATLFPLNIKEENITIISRWLNRRRITVWHSVPTLYRYFINSLTGTESFPYLRFLVMGGEAVLSDDVHKFQKFFPQSLFVNLYGQSESSFNSAQLIDANTSFDKVLLGQPIEEVELLVLNEEGEETQVFEEGEIVVLNNYSALGYWNDDEKTAEVFVDVPDLGRLYRTGDMGRVDYDGSVEFTGRKDFQIKIRGYRVELGEIESLLLKHHHIEKAVVIANKEADGTTYLCAYVVPTEGEKLNVPDLREYLSQELLEHMIPSYFVALDELPVTPTGKIDRKRLPAIEGHMLTGAEYAPPTNEIEKALVSFWQDILALDRIGINDNFFDLGGHSLKATVLTARIHKELQVDFPLREMFRTPTIKGMARFIQGAETSIYASIQPAPMQLYYPLSAAQTRIFTLAQMDEDGTGYNMPDAVEIDGPLDKEKLQKVFDKLIARHESLRSSFHIVENTPRQQVHKRGNLDWTITQLPPCALEEDDEITPSTVAELMEMFVQPFDLTRAPLLRVGLAQKAKEKFVLVMDMHHIISDGSTKGILIKELCDLYADRELPPMRIQYKDYALWQQEMTGSGALKEQEQYWLKEFSGQIPVLELPTDFPRPAVQSFEGDFLDFRLDSQLTGRLKQVASETGATLYMILLAIYTTLLARLANREDIVVGTASAGRPHADLQSIAGMFVNTLCMRNFPAAEKTFLGFLDELKERVLKAFENQDYQFDELVEHLELRRDLSRNPLFDTMFALQNLEQGERDVEELTFTRLDHQEKTSRFDLTLVGGEATNFVGFRWEYCTALFKKDTIARFSGYFKNLAQSAASFPLKKLVDLDMISEEEKQRLLFEFNDTKADYCDNKPVHLLFEEQAARTPENIALIGSSLVNLILAGSRVPDEGSELADAELVYSLDYTEDLDDAGSEGETYFPKDTADGERDEVTEIETGKTGAHECGKGCCGSRGSERGEGKKTFSCCGWDCGAQGNWEVRYDELNGMSNRLARLLMEKGLKGGKIAGILLPSSVEMVVAILAVLKAGGAYLPLDTNYPADRINFMLSDSSAPFLLTMSDLTPNLLPENPETNNGSESPEQSTSSKAVQAGGPGGASPWRSPRRGPRRAAGGTTYETLFLEELEGGDDGENLEAQCGAADAAYVIYTSGSTGRPKGVLVEHRSLVNLCAWHNRYYEVSPSDRATKYAGVGFDASVWEIFPYLTAGARVYIVPEEIKLDMEKLNDFFHRNGITIAFLPTQACEQFMKLDNRSLRFLLAGGDKLREYTPRSYKLINNYGPTENTVVTTCFEVNNQYANIPIGKPTANTEIYILDSRGEIQPMGVAGELCISGHGLARGYLNNPELTAEKFVVHSGVPPAALRGPLRGERLGEAPPGPPVALRAGGEVLYRTGDLARWLDNGNIEFLGRIDFQVQVRGFRIEPGEIETCILEHPSVNETVVTARADEQGQTYLCAYVTAEKDKEVSIPDLREHLLDRLPDYMLPAYFVQMEKLPQTTAGKVDRKNLPDPGRDRVSGSSFQAPRDELETRLAGIWQEILNAGPVGIHDHFFDIGGHSLKASILASRIQKELLVQFPLKEIFNNPTLDAMAAYIRGAVICDAAAVEPAEQAEYYPLSSAQRRLFTLHQLEDQHTATAYNMPAVLLVEGKLDVNRLEGVFKTLVARHESLRTAFFTVKGEPVQQVSAPENTPFAIDYWDDLYAPGKVKSLIPPEPVDASKAKSIEELIERFIRPFNLSQAPLLRVCLAGLEPERYLLLADMHHIISDGTSVGLLTKELTDLYAGKELPPLRVQYKDYALWQEKMFRAGKIAEQEAFWKEQFAGDLPVLEMAYDFPRPALQRFDGDTYAFNLDAELTADLTGLAGAHNATLFMILAAVYNVFLSRYSGGEDIVVGTPTAGRSHWDLEKMVGMFVNTLALRNYPGRKKAFDLFLAEVKENSLAAFDNQDYQFEALVERLELRRDLSRNPLFDTMLTLQNLDISEPTAEELVFKPYPFENKVAKFDLMLTAFEGGEELAFAFQFNTHLFTAETVARMARHFRNIIAHVTADPMASLETIDMMSKEERQQVLLGFNETTRPFASDDTLHGLFEEQVVKNSYNRAILWSDRRHRDAGNSERNRPLNGNLLQWTYEELDQQASEVAANLTAKGVKKGSIVAVLMERSPEMMAGIYGILKAGGAYLPIAPDTPQSRVDYILADSNAAALLTIHRLENEISEEGIACDTCAFHGPTLYLDRLEKRLEKPGEVGEAEGSAVATPGTGMVCQPDDPAYVIYTSGSTGNPKGVLVEHRSAVNVLMAMQEQYPVEENDVYLLKTAVVFDVSVSELFGWFWKGGALMLLEKEGEKEPAKILKAIEKAGITHINFVPSMFGLFVEALDKNTIKALKSLKYIFLAGEVLPPSLVGAFCKLGTEILLANIYGPTEATVYSTSYRLPSGGECLRRPGAFFQASLNRSVTGAPGPGKNFIKGVQRLPIGEPLANVRCYVIGKNNRVQPVGIAGELCIAGACLARGYLNRPQLTAEKFVPFIPGLSTAVQGPFYRTGDLVRWLPDGNIEFLDRIDSQVKVRGFRIEPGEIETTLLAHEAVKEAVVITKEDETGSAYLCAYLVFAAPLEWKPEVRELREHLSKTLPHYMVPSYFVELERIPLTPSGKRDRRALPEPSLVGHMAESGVPGAAGIEPTADAPRDELEEKLADIWKEVLNLSYVGVSTNFFELGGHSLKATRLISLVHQELNISLLLAEVFKNPTIRGLAERIKKSGRAGAFEKIEKAPPQEHYILSSVQRRMYLAFLTNPANRSYNLPTAVELHGELDRDLFESVLQKLVDRHESFRTSFLLIDGSPAQKILENVVFKVIYYDLYEKSDNAAEIHSLKSQPNNGSVSPTPQTSIKATLDGGQGGALTPPAWRAPLPAGRPLGEPPEAAVSKLIDQFVRPFDLSQPPLLRVELIRTEEEKHILLLDMHHIIADGTSLNVFLSEFMALYHGDSLPLPLVQYKDFTLWQESDARKEAVKAQESYWLSQFRKEAPLLQLPLDFPRPAVKNYEGRHHRFILDKEDSMKLNHLARQEEATLFMLLLAIYNVFLGKLGGHEDVVVGTSIAGRRHAEVQDIIGMFVNALPLRNYPEGNKTFKQFLREVRDNTLAAYDNQDYQFEDLVEKVAGPRDTSRNPLFDTMLVLNNEEEIDEFAIPGLVVKPCAEYEHETAQLDLKVRIREIGDILTISFEHSTNLFKPETVAMFETNFREVISNILTNPAILIKDIKTTHGLVAVEDDISDVDFAF